MGEIHQPVLVEEVIEGLHLASAHTVVDATVGAGGHTRQILEKCGPQALVIGIDRDAEILEIARKNLTEFKDRVKLIHGHFGELAQRLDEVGKKTVDAVLFDLGVSSFQLDEERRGFSFRQEGPLDMRMDQQEAETASDVINRMPLPMLTDVIRTYGEERFAGRIARSIFRARPLSTTTALAQVIRDAVPPHYRHGRIDAATRTFQAIRIVVNRELELLPLGLSQAIDRLKSGGRLVVLSYHSLEDRIVKQLFVKKKQEGTLTVVTKKPIQPSESETAMNPRARSARLRVGQRS